MCSVRACETKRVDALITLTLLQKVPNAKSCLNYKVACGPNTNSRSACHHAFMRTATKLGQSTATHARASIKAIRYRKMMLHMKYQLLTKPDIGFMDIWLLVWKNYGFYGELWKEVFRRSNVTVSRKHHFRCRGRGVALWLSRPNCIRNRFDTFRRASRIFERLVVNNQTPRTEPEGAAFYVITYAATSVMSTATLALPRFFCPLYEEARP